MYSFTPIAALADLTFVMSLVFCPIITRFKPMFYISSLCHVVTYSVYMLGLKEQWSLLVALLGAFFGGYGAAIVWVSQRGLMMQLFGKQRATKDQEGRYYAILNGTTYLSSLIGAAITTFRLGFFGTTLYFAIISAIGLLYWVLCTFLLDDLRGS